MFVLLQANFGYFETYANKRCRNVLKKINTRAAHWVTCRCFSVTRLDQTRRRAWRHRSIIVMTQMSHYQWQMWRATGYLFTSIACNCSLKITCLLLHRIVTKKMAPCCDQGTNHHQDLQDPRSWPEFQTWARWSGHEDGKGGFSTWKSYEHIWNNVKSWMELWWIVAILWLFLGGPGVFNAWHVGSWWW